MPLRNDLLNPISPENPAGQNLRRDAIWDKIKEARREDPDVPQGDWKRERKTADWPLTIKLISEALATKTKDLQLVAWLAEAMLRREGLEGLRQALDLARGMMENFWDTLYPEIEDGDLELRAGPLQWMGDKLDVPVKLAPLTRGGLNWVQFRESREVGTEESVVDDYEKQKARQEKIEEGKIPQEKFDKDFAETPKDYYVKLEQSFDGTLESIRLLTEFCDEKFPDREMTPSFGTLRKSVEEVRQTVHVLLVEKREIEPDEESAASESEEAAAPEEEAAPAASYSAPTSAAAAPARAPVAGRVAAEPLSWDDAIARVVAVAKYMRHEDLYNPAPYLILRGLRWGELRAGGSIDESKLVAPPTQIRQQIKALALDSNWLEVLEKAEVAMGMECGRGWLDLQRYTARACSELGSNYEPIRSAVISAFRSLLSDFPQLHKMTLIDDTPTANAETVAWIKEEVATLAAAAAPVASEPSYDYSESDAEPAEEESSEPRPPDAFELAMEAARSGRAEDGIEILMREMAQEPSGRARFHRKVQVAQLCLASGNEAVALPVLQEAAEEIEQRKLDQWEARETIARPLALLYRCMAKQENAADQRQKIYAWICRLDPVAAMKIAR